MGRSPKSRVLCKSRLLRIVTIPRTRTRTARRALAPVALAVCVVTGLTAVGSGAVPASASASSRLRTRTGAIAPTPRSGRLSPRLATLAHRRSFASPRAEASALSLPVVGPGSLMTEPGGRVLVQIRTASTASPTIARLRDAGADVVNVNADYSIVTAMVAPGALETLAHDTDVAYATEVLRPITAATATTNTAASPRAVTPAGTCRPTISEGDTLMNVAAARAANQVDGTGQTIGILSDSFDTNPSAPTHAADDIATGDLPGSGNPCGYTTPVKVQADDAGSGPGDEGRAMAELAHGLAPGAHLAFATGDFGQFDFATQINNLRDVNHATVIADDLAYLDEPFFQDGPISQAANAASAGGVPYFTAAGNDNVIVAGKDVSSYEAPAYRETACPLSVLNFETLLGCHDFDPGAGTDTGADITLAAGGGFALDLQWAQPWGITGTDFDAFLVDDAGNVVASSRLDQGQLLEPFEFIGYTNSTGSTQTVHIVIGRFSGSGAPRLKYVLLGASGMVNVQYNTSSGGDIVGPTIFGHGGAALVGSTAAIPYDNPNASEEYSSHGPATLYFNPTPSTVPLASPQVSNKPDFAATDDVQNVFFAEPSGGVYRFAGTSAAAPQAAAIGALLRQYDPGLDSSQLMAAMRSTARPVTTNGAPLDVGGGYLDAQAALASVFPVPSTPRIDTETNGNGQVTLHWTDATAGPTVPVTGYTVTPIRAGVSQAPRVFNTSVTQHVITGLQNGGAYSFIVSARNVNGAGQPSSPSSPMVVGRPSAPVSVTSVPGNARATVSWQPPVLTWGLKIQSYELQTFKSGALVNDRVLNSTATSTTVTGLVNGGSYAFAVKAKNATSASIASARSGEVTIGAPRAPGGVTATGGHKSAKVSWKAAVDNGQPVTGYVVTPYIGSVAQATRPLKSAATSATISNLVTGQHYSFRVEARNARGLGMKSAPSNVVAVT